MNEYPLLFTFREIVEGNGFVAGVECNGRGLMVNAGDEGWHLSGVEPGALSELGGSPHEAYFYFRKAFTQALKVIAGDARDFKDFEGQLTAFGGWVDQVEAERWQAAREQLRGGGECDAPFQELPKETAEEPRGVRAVCLDKPRDESEVRSVAGPDVVGIPAELPTAA